ncbi:MAG: hypothetical protein FJ202_12035 [Gemmatimonadetes bacterium]|nr:hypothetical protein [Gemmatimonadota bacterium]
MRKCRLALLVAMLILVLMPRDGQSQSGQSNARKSAGALSQNYPNPFNPETRSAFTVGQFEQGCPEGGRQYKVSLRVFNILAQQVAVPQLEGGSAGVAGGQRVENMSLPCGRYTVYWNGKYDGTQREVASGVYLWALEVDGVRVGVKRSTVAK